MPVVNSDFQRVPSRYACLPELVITGSKVSLKPFTFVHNGTAYSIEESQDFEVQSQAFPCTITGYLVKIRETGEPALLVDELLHDGVDLPYHLDGGSPYELMFVLYCFDVPPNSTDLANVTITLNRVTPVTQEAPRG